MTLTIDGTEVPFDDSGHFGWSWGDRNNGEILLAPDACSASRHNGATLMAALSCARP
ncbi:MAG: hypothetical protein QM756_39325 [Polyangiaceae bacterium]